MTGEERRLVERALECLRAYGHEGLGLRGEVHVVDAIGLLVGALASEEERRESMRWLVKALADADVVAEQVAAAGVSEATMNAVARLCVEVGKKGGKK